jgi:hypothetical protein
MSSAATIVPLEFGEPAPDSRDHHVLDLELDARVRRVDLPGPGGDAHDSLHGQELCRQLTSACHLPFFLSADEGTRT